MSGATSANVQPCFANRSILVEGFYDEPYSSLRGVSELPHSVSDWLKPLP